MSKSINRVKAAALAANLNVKIERMPESTRTAEDAAEACDCDIGQIVKSLIFEGSETGVLKLLLVSGTHDVDLTRAKAIFGEPLQRADPKRVRIETGFAIGGVSPIGHKSEIETWMDAELLNYETVWVAAGAPNAVFSVSPSGLMQVTKAELFQVG